MTRNALVLSSVLTASFLSFAGACSGGDGDGDDGSGNQTVDASAGGESDAMPGQPDAAISVPDAMPAGTLCQAKDPVQVGHSCDYTWSTCSDSATYLVSCRIQNVAGNVFSLCDCYRNNVKGANFGSTDICAAASWEELEVDVNEKCGWDLY